MSALGVMGWRMTFLSAPTEGVDQTLLFEGRAPVGGFVPPHHEENHEAFYVVEGEFEIEVDGVATCCGPGDFRSGRGWCTRSGTPARAGAGSSS